MQIRRNTKSFKTILAIISSCQSRPDREKLIRLYITKAGHTLDDRISVEGIQGDSQLFYEMNYQTVLNNLKSPNHQLHQSDDIPGLYFFHSTSNKGWDETPFEFDEAIKKQFASLPDLPVFRKKEKTEKFVFPVAKEKAEPKPVKKNKEETKKTVKQVDRGPKQPNYSLKHKIDFTNLARIVFRQANRTKKEILDYYNQVAGYMLPHLKTRHVVIRTQTNASKSITYSSIAELKRKEIQIPDWIQPDKRSKDKLDASGLVCNDKEHLLFYTEIGCVQYNSSHSSTKSVEFPDYIIIGIESPDAELAKATEVALGAKEILSGLSLPAFVKTDGKSGLHIYIPLDSKSKIAPCSLVAEYICKLIRIKMPDVVAIEGYEKQTYGKVLLRHFMNEDDRYAVAPYSLVAGDSATVATPLLWDELNEKLSPENFTPESILKRLKHTGDPFEGLFKKKINAGILRKKMDDYYSFLF